MDGKNKLLSKNMLFRHQINMSEHEEQNVRDLSIFILRIYLTAWFTAPCAALTPFSDIKLIQDFDNYKNGNIVVSTAAMESVGPFRFPSSK